MRVIEYIVAGIIVAIAAVMLWRSLRRRSRGDCSCGCDDCPYRRDCTGTKHD